MQGDYTSNGESTYPIKFNHWNELPCQILATRTLSFSHYQLTDEYYMREIKFRFWNTKQKKMSKEWSMEDLAYEGFPPQYVSEYDDILNNECIVMQYTGLTDKKGKEIYEGDLLIEDESWESTEDEQQGHWNFEVRWDKEIGGYELYVQEEENKERNVTMGDEWKDFVKESDGKTLNTFEIIGNIYQNPELSALIKE